MGSSPRRSKGLDPGEENAKVGEYQGDGGEHIRTGWGCGDSVDPLGRVLPAVPKGCSQGMDGVVNQIYCLKRGYIAVFEKVVQLEPERAEAAVTAQVHLKGGRGDQGRNGTVMVRTKGARLSLIHI